MKKEKQNWENQEEVEAIQKPKIIKAWAIVPAFSNNKELEGLPFLDDSRCFLLFLSKKWAEKANGGMDEDIAEVEIKIKN